jgi:hypothetical protein
VSRRRNFILSLLALTACSQEQPARIVDPTTRSRAELLRVVTQALGGAPVLLADDALTRASTLVIERNPPRDVQGRPLAGRELGKPQQFRLVKIGSACVLLHENDGERSVLAETTCVLE